MACPCFIPEEICTAALWPHRQRLPLGEGFAGRCAAALGAPCSEDELRLHCNLGYASCGRLPATLPFDAARFAVTAEDGVLRVRWVCECGHLPAAQGELRYRLADGSWSEPPEAALAELAAAAVRGWLARARRQTQVQRKVAPLPGAAASK
jgi:hypothetical protein